MKIIKTILEVISSLFFVLIDAIQDNLPKIIFTVVLSGGCILYILFVPGKDGISAMHAEAQIQLNGDLLVEETWTVSANKNSFESFQREYINPSNSAERYDEFQILEVYINDKLCTPNSENTNEASYVINENKNKTTVTWKQSLGTGKFNCKIKYKLTNIIKKTDKNKVIFTDEFINNNLSQKIRNVNIIITSPKEVPMTITDFSGTMSLKENNTYIKLYHKDKSYQKNNTSIKPYHKNKSYPSDCTILMPQEYFNEDVQYISEENLEDMGVSTTPWLIIVFIPVGLVIIIALFDIIGSYLSKKKNEKEF